MGNVQIKEVIVYLLVFLVNEGIIKLKLLFAAPRVSWSLAQVVKLFLVEGADDLSASQFFICIAQ